MSTEAKQKMDVIWNTGDINNFIYNLEVFFQDRDLPHTKDEVLEILAKCNAESKRNFSPKYAISFPYAYGYDRGYMIQFTNSEKYLNGVGHPFEREGERSEFILQW
jgi:hypothetical protein